VESFVTKPHAPGRPTAHCADDVTMQCHYDHKNYRELLLSLCVL